MGAPELLYSTHRLRRRRTSLRFQYRGTPSKNQKRLSPTSRCSVLATRLFSPSSLCQHSDDLGFQKGMFCGILLAQCEVEALHGM